MKNKIANCIIITHNVDEAEALHKFLKIDFKREHTDSLHKDEEFYNQDWYWIYKTENNKVDFSGSGGYKALEHSVNRYPDFAIKTLYLFLLDNDGDIPTSFKSDKNLNQILDEQRMKEFVASVKSEGCIKQWSDQDVLVAIQMFVNENFKAAE